MIQNLQNSMKVFTLSVLDRKYHFWANSVQKSQNSQFKLKFGIQTNLNVKNSIMMFVFSIFDRKYPFFGGICSKKSKLLVEVKI